MFSGIKLSQVLPSSIVNGFQPIHHNPSHEIQDALPPCPRNLQPLWRRGPGLRGLGRILYGLWIWMLRGSNLCTKRIRWWILYDGRLLHCWRLPMSGHQLQVSGILLPRSLLLADAGIKQRGWFLCVKLVSRVCYACREMKKFTIFLHDFIGKIRY